MLPKIILHNSISLDGSLIDFDVNMQIHYKIARDYKPNAHLIGSNTIKSGIELYDKEIPKETEKDFEKPKRDKNLPYWIIIDTRGICHGLLHTCRSFEFCKDVIVLTSKKTPRKYIDYLNERSYDNYCFGINHIDLKKSLDFFYKQYKCQTILVDTGKILGNILINQGHINEISLLIHPVIVGNNRYCIFDLIKSKIKLDCIKNKSYDGGYVWLVYKVQ